MLSGSGAGEAAGVDVGDGAGVSADEAGGRTVFVHGVYFDGVDCEGCTPTDLARHYRNMESFSILKAIYAVKIDQKKIKGKL